jgi:hypothetical protein
MGEVVGNLRVKLLVNVEPLPTRRFQLFLPLLALAARLCGADLTIGVKLEHEIGRLVPRVLT